MGVGEIEAREWREEHLIGDVGVLLTCAVLLKAVPTAGGLGGSLGGGGDGNGHGTRYGAAERTARTHAVCPPVQAALRLRHAYGRYTHRICTSQMGYGFTCQHGS